VSDEAAGAAGGVRAGVCDAGGGRGELCVGGDGCDYGGEAGDLSQLQAGVSGATPAATAPGTCPGGGAASRSLSCFLYSSSIILPRRRRRERSRKTVTTK